MKLKILFDVISALVAYLFAMVVVIVFLFAPVYLTFEGGLALSKYQAGNPIYAILWLGCLVFVLLVMFPPRRQRMFTQ